VRSVVTIETELHWILRVKTELVISGAVKFWQHLDCVGYVAGVLLFDAAVY
jgi:hypothetical protein